MKTLTLSAALALVSSAPLFANGGGYLQGVKSTGPFRPVNVDNVQMVSEKLDIELQQDAAVVNITYALHNPGKAVKVEMGFPCSVVVTPKSFEFDPQTLPKSLPQLEGFSLVADGEPVKSELVKDHATLPVDELVNRHGNPYGKSILTGWQLVKLPFKAEQTRMVKVSYRNPYYRETSSISDNSDVSAPSMRYLFSAAALWAGPIRTGEVTIRATGVDPELVTLSHPKRFQREGSKWTWSFTDFEPTMQDDLEIIAGEHEFSQWRESETGAGGAYVMRGKSSDHKELQKSGKWFYIGREYTATASSTLKADPGFNYGPENLNDRDWENAWAEGAEGDGIGESITLTMKQPQKLTRLYIANGYRKDPTDGGAAVYQNNNRVKRMSVSLNGGKPFSVQLPDDRKEKGIIELPKDAGVVKTVKLTIEEVYRGAKFRDTCISGVDVEVQLTKAPPIFPCR
jgi:hypothetical protein